MTTQPNLAPLACQAFFFIFFPLPQLFFNRIAAHFADEPHRCRLAFWRRWRWLIARGWVGRFWPGTRKAPQQRPLTGRQESVR